VFIVWEPILPTDWQSPTSPVLSRVSDLRAVQFWDKHHLVADALRKHVPEDQPGCCVRDGHIWDVVALYPKQAVFESTSPTFIGGPVVQAEPNMRPKLQDALR
jgi:hypothetical protein